ncbi:AAA family ATPase [Candidatus Bathyarchaeota archaeon]|nr:AAA family ATPase [Candidatus Bathyarchaeota archaeon]
MAPSSPILFPSSPAPQRTKRPRQDEAPRAPAPPPQKVGGFMMDDDSDDDEEAPEPLPKKRMTETQLNGSLPPAAPAADSQPSTTGSPLPDAQPDLPELMSRNIDELPDLSQIAPLGSAFAAATRTYSLKTCDGAVSTVGTRKPAPVSYESMIAARSKTKEGRAKRAYYGIEIHELTRLASLEIEHQKEARQQHQERRPDTPPPTSNGLDASGKKSKKTMLWTEKYRARKFTDLCGDDGTNRLVLRWIKRWDPVVFPGSAKPKPKPVHKFGDEPPVEEKPHKKILLLTGPPGLGKTTLVHVCARQAGYEVVEINASDDRSRNVVNNRIRTSLGTENVKTVTNARDSSKLQKPARPVCVIVDEVDGVTTGSGPSGEGGFIKALIDLVTLDQKNAASAGMGESSTSRKKKKGDDFRQRRPLILICNDVYHPALRPLRQSNLAEIIHVGKPSIDAVVGRLSLVFEKEGISCEKDASRKICEAAWGMSSGTSTKKGAESTVQGDLRGIMVVGEWVAGRYRAALPRPDKLSRNWVEKHVIQDLASGARGTGRGGTRDVVSRVFQEGAGFPRQAMSTAQSKNLLHEQPKEQLGFSELHKRNGMAQLQQMVDTSGDVDRIMADIISEYPIHEFNDDSYLTKPNEAYDWFHFLDSCSTKIYSDQEWELMAYLSQPVLACHDLFASSARGRSAAYDDAWGAKEDGTERSRFFGPRASYAAYEAEKHTREALQALQAGFSPTVGRLFRSPEDLARDFMPYLPRLVAPAVNPVLVGGNKGMSSTASVRREGERRMVVRAAETMAEAGLTLQKGRLDGDPMAAPQWVYRMEPDLDELADFETLSRAGSASTAPTRYAVRQALDQELQRVVAAREEASRQARFQAGGTPGVTSAAPRAAAPSNDKGDNKADKVKRDFFGRVVEESSMPLRGKNRGAKDKVRVWVKYHEGFNNAVRRPITLKDFMKIL